MVFSVNFCALFATLFVSWYNQDWKNSNHQTFVIYDAIIKDESLGKSPQNTSFPMNSPWRLPQQAVQFTSLAEAGPSLKFWIQPCYFLFACWSLVLPLSPAVVTHVSAVFHESVKPRSEKSFEFGFTGCMESFTMHFNLSALVLGKNRCCVWNLLKYMVTPRKYITNKYTV